MRIDAKPTRMELLNIKKRIGLAKKGHKLLKDKRDALFNEFFQAINVARQLRKDVDGQLAEAYRALALAYADVGTLKLSEFAGVSSEHSELSFESGEKNIMGVKSATIGGVSVKRSFDARGYSVLDSTAAVDDAARQFEEALEKILKLAESETLIVRLGNEIEKTKRKVNSLEYNVIPALDKARKYIAFRLEEMERDKFFVLKKVKKKIEARAAA